MIFTLSSTMLLAGNTSDKSATAVNTENKMSAEDVARMTKRVEEIRSMDKSELTVTEKRELRKEVKGIRENVRKNNGVIYISGGTILLIILILLLI